MINTGEVTKKQILNCLSRLSAGNESTTNILVKSCDTDVLMIMFGNMDHLKSDSSSIHMEYKAANKRSVFEFTRGSHHHRVRLQPFIFQKGQKRPFQIIKNALTDLAISDVPEWQYETFTVLENLSVNYTATGTLQIYQCVK